MFNVSASSCRRCLPLIIRTMPDDVLSISNTRNYLRKQYNHFIWNSTKETLLYRSQHMFFFSTMAMGQTHGHLNDLLKRDCGVIGITDNRSALIK